jgi:hypothetical protein
MDNEPTLTIDKYGTKHWRLPNGTRHRLDGPAVELVSGTKLWFRHGNSHREDGPSDEYADGTKRWMLNGDLHRVDGPACEYAYGRKEWWLNDEMYDFDDWLEANTYISEEEKVMLKLQYG